MTVKTSSSRMTPDRQVHIIARSLSIAIAAIERTAPQNQPLSDLRDMKALLETLLETDKCLEIYMNSARPITEHSTPRH